MRILIEEYQYILTDHDRQHDLKCILKELGGFENIEGRVSVNYVGYYYSPELKDCVFILPKVLLSIDENKNELVFGKHSPEDIINIDEDSPLSEEQRRFIYEFSVWIYRAIDVFRVNSKQTGIIYYKHNAQMSKGRRKVCNTFLDVILSLIQFNKENQDFFFFILRNLHSGMNKINWTKTISKSQSIVQGNEALYLNPVNKKRRINFDEELLIIFFSILNYVNDKYGFSAEINANFNLIPKCQFEIYLSGFGKARLLQIKYKYFSDKALQLWELCYAFFERSHKIAVSTELQEYLLAKDFNIVFESMIDELVGDKIPQKDRRLRELKEQLDGKMVDHLYQWQNLVNNDDEDKNVYYIGDSKYYKKNNPIGRESVYKQFTYARNVIQWNIDLFNDGTDDEKKGHIKLRDDVTEGYHIIPNFFISAQQNTLEKRDDIHLTDKSEKYFFSRQFENRLFDRDTFLIAHYDVNFLFIVALYGRNNLGEKESWKRKVRKMFRTEIQNMLKDKFLFYALTPYENVDAEEYIREHFQYLLGKVFKPFEDVDNQQYFSLALRSPKGLKKPEEQNLRVQIETENEGIRQILSQYFYMAECELGVNPSTLTTLPKVEYSIIENIPDEFRTRYYFEAFKNSVFLIGCYKNSEHLSWIFGRTGKRDNMYNVRIDKKREGGVAKSKAKKAPEFLFLYSYEKPIKEGLMMFKIHNAADTPYEFMKRTGYPNLQDGHNYVSYILEQSPITFGEFDIAMFLREYKELHTEYVNGAPIFIQGSELIKYRIN
ncbi:MAG: restriction endonuclease [Paludibacteraceae bacterium]|nr:restriction endonuclease [Paludibacteraceae bacterium]